jgi:hypothetical protein
MGHPQNRMLGSCITFMELLLVTSTVSQEQKCNVQYFFFSMLITQNFTFCDTVYSTECTLHLVQNDHCFPLHQS